MEDSMGFIEKLKALSLLLRLQKSDWKNSIRYEIRFILCGIFSFLTFSTFEMLKDVIKGRENEFIELFFISPETFVLACLVIVISYFTLYLSIISAALFASLLPIDKQ
jgi:hypothetical protein